MRKPLVVGILRETKYAEQRTPLVPSDVRWLRCRHIRVEVESSKDRIYADREYKKAGAVVVDSLRSAQFLVGVKEPDLERIYANKIYMVFSHTIKGRCSSRPLLQRCMQKKITLIDYEKVVDDEERRLVYFGKFAGICGAIDSLHYLGEKFKARGILSPFLDIKTAHDYKSLSSAENDIGRIARKIRTRGLDGRITPFVVGITGHGNVSEGVQYILDLFNPIEIHPRDMHRFVHTNRSLRTKICTIIFDREEKLRSKKGGGFYFEDYLKNPKKFESNMDYYLSHINILFHGSYWDKRFPRLVTKEMVEQMCKKPNRLVFIGDISCDVRGGIEITYKTTTVDNATYTYNPRTNKYRDGCQAEGIAILARDNLPTELPREASGEFSRLIREYVYQIAAHGVINLTEHVAIPQELRKAVVLAQGKLTKPFRYLRACL